MAANSTVGGEGVFVTRTCFRDVEPFSAGRFDFGARNLSLINCKGISIKALSTNQM